MDEEEVLRELARNYLLRVEEWRRSGDRAADRALQFATLHLNSGAQRASKEAVDHVWLEFALPEGLKPRKHK